MRFGIKSLWIRIADISAGEYNIHPPTNESLIPTTCTIHSPKTYLAYPKRPICSCYKLILAIGTSSEPNKSYTLGQDGNSAPGASILRNIIEIIPGIRGVLGKG